MEKIEIWLIWLGLLNLGLFLFGLKFFMPNDFFKEKNVELLRIIKKHFFYILIIIGVVGFHLIQVNFIDQAATEFVGKDFAASIQNIEGDFVFWFSQHWTPVLLYFFVIMYIGTYPFTLWFSPAYFLINDKKKSMKTLAYGLLLIYVVALPFYLFMPITNVYKFYNIESALETVIPTVENFFYSTTTQNNCLPSLHTAMAILIAESVRLTGNKKFTYFAYFSAVCVIISVIYLSIHWVMDVLFGGILSIIAILILRHLFKEK